jgi:hypothetical protein
MANLASDETTDDAALNLIDGQFAVDFAQPLPEAGAGQPAFAAKSLRTGPGFMAVQVQAGWPARVPLLSAVAASPIANLLVPLGHGAVPMPSGDMGYFVICQAPPGRPLTADLRPWSEHELIELLIRPVALALADLHERHVTHRAIRLDNLFRAGATDSVTLGCAWAAPPACRQPVLSEPPYSAVCMPAGRGDGAPADDIYALGVLLVTLALGRNPLAGVDDETIIRSNLDQGSYVTIVGRHRLPTAVAELARGMLADDPEHRPSAILLCDPAAARARRIAARPQRRAQRAFPLGEPPAWTARVLARALMNHPDQGVGQLRGGAVSLWLRRGIGDGVMASRIDEVCNLREQAALPEEPRADALLVARAVAVLDPLAPLSWRKLAIWPDGLGAALNQALHASPVQAIALAEIASAEVPLAQGVLRPDRSDMNALKADARQQRPFLNTRPPETGTLRLNYALNPLAPCESPLLAGRWVTRLADLLPAMEIAASGPLRGKLPPVDRHIAAFVSVRRDERAQADLGQLASAVTPGDPIQQLRLLARLQERTHPEPLPALTAWMAEVVAPTTASFHSQGRRTRLAERLVELGRGGQLPPLVALLDDPPAHASDRSGRQIAVERGAAIDAELEALKADILSRQVTARRVGHDVTSGISLLVCGVALAAALFL